MTADARPLAIGVVAYEMENRPTGVGRYLEGLLGGLIDGSRDAGPLDGRAGKLTLFLKGTPFEHPLWSAPGGRVETVFDRRPDARPIAWEQLRLPRLLRRHDLDLVFSPSYSLPPRLKVPAMVTIHDLSFEHLPENFPWRQRWRRRWLARRAARNADRVLADTERIAAELMAMYRLPPERVAVIPPAVDDRFRAAPDPDDAARVAALGIDRPYVLLLGTVLGRRRPDLSLAAFDRLAAEREDLLLVIAGPNRLTEPARLDRWIAATRARSRVRRIDWIDERSLPALYRRAEAALYLSTYEGYGLPPLEALACGTPCVVSAGLGLDDLWPGYPLRVDLDAAAAKAAVADTVAAAVADTVADALRRSLADEGRTLGTEGARRMASLDWRAAAERFLAEARAVVAARAGA